MWKGRGHIINFARLLLCILLAVSIVGCEGQAGSVLPGSGDSEQAAEEVEDIDIEGPSQPTVRSEIGRAERVVESNYEEFLERQPMGFDFHAIEELGPALARAWSKATQELRPNSGSGTISGALQASLPLTIFALFLLLLVGIDRQAWRLATRAHSRAHSVAWNWLQDWLRIGIAVAGRGSPVALLVVLSYFPIQAVFDRAAWSHALTALLWLLLGYRVLRTTVAASFAFGLFEVADVHAMRVETFTRRTLRLVFGSLAVLAVAEELGAGAETRAFLVFCFELAVLVVPVYLLFMKASVIALLPEPDGGIYARLHSAIVRYFRALIMWSAFLLGLRAIGYDNAATFILLRGYGLLLLIVVVVAGGTRLRRWLHHNDMSGEEHRNLIRSIDWALRVGAILTIVYVALRLVRIWDALVIVLEIPLLTVGGASISTYSIIEASLFFAGAVFLSRLVRAVLVMRVFPAFGVDVGVGYAVQVLVNYAMIVVGFFVALVTLGVNLSAMTVVLASLGVGIGFGLQTITENLISGFIILFGRSVKKGDIVTVGDAFGQVHAVGARSVLIRTNDNFDLLIPSKEIVGGRIINWSYADTLIRHRIPVGVTYSCKPREVEKVLLAAAKKHPQVLEEPAPEVWLDSFGDSSVNFILLVYFDCMKITRDRLNGQLNFEIWDALAEADIEIPFPQRDLHLRSIEFADELRGSIKREKPAKPDEEE